MARRKGCLPQFTNAHIIKIEVFLRDISCIGYDCIFAEQDELLHRTGDELQGLDLCNQMVNRRTIELHFLIGSLTQVLQETLQLCDCASWNTALDRDSNSTVAAY